MEQLSIFENEREFDYLNPIESNDWKWCFKDYPEKNGLKVFSCFAGGGVQLWAINYVVVMLLAVVN